MGGIGKTVTGAALVRDAQIRDYYDQIIWIPLGQTPVIEKLQGYALKQLNGKVMAADTTQEEKRELLRRAMVGKRVLLALDDLWHPEHEEDFSLLDPSTDSRVLISTRVRGILTNAAAVEVGVPTEEQAIDILMVASDMSGEPQPAQVRTRSWFADITRYREDLLYARGTQ
jgi:hypothetical protein